MIKLFNFCLGFFCCVILGVLLYSTNIISSAQNNILNFKTVEYPIFVNQSQQNIEAYNLNGHTYLKISDLNKLIDSLEIIWIEENKEVHINERIGIIDIDNKKYFSLSNLIRRYEIGTLPYCFEYSGFSTPEGTFINLEYEFVGERIYYPYDDIIKNLVPYLSDIINENEKYIKEHPNYKIEE